MKHQVSISIEEDLLLRLKEKLRDGTFRNQSHLFELAVRRMLEEKNDK